MGDSLSPVARAALERSGAVLGLTHQEWDNVLMFATWRTMAPGEALFAQGAPGDSLALVVAGEFSVRVRSGGSDREFMRVGAGEVIGEMACLDPAPRSATVVALTTAHLITLDRTAFLVMTEHLPHVASRITGLVIERVNARLAEIDRRLDEIMGVSAAPAPLDPVTKPASGPPDAFPAPPLLPSEPKPPWWRSLLDRVQGAR